MGFSRVDFLRQDFLATTTGDSVAASSTTLADVLSMPVEEQGEEFVMLAEAGDALLAEVEEVLGQEVFGEVLLAGEVEDENLPVPEEEEEEEDGVLLILVEEEGVLLMLEVEEGVLLMQELEEEGVL